MVVKSLENMSMKVLGCISLMSAPAAKAFSPPASRMQPILSSASRSSTAAAISLNTPKDSALSIFGRFSVMTPTAPLLSTMMCSNVLMVHPARDFTGQCARWGDRLQVGNGTPSRHCEERQRRSNPACTCGFWIASRSVYRARIRGTRRLAMKLPNEHARGGGHRQQRTKANEDFPDQGGLLPGGAFVAACRRYGRRRRLGRGHQQHRRGRRAFVQRAIDIVELIGGDDLAFSSRLRVSGPVWRA